MRISLFLFSALWMTSCQTQSTPKPRAEIRIDIPAASYAKISPSDCSFSFDQNQLSELRVGKNCQLKLEYPSIKGDLYMTYKAVNGNIESLLSDAQKLSREHMVKADNIVEQPYIDLSNDVYGMYYEVIGDAASQAQFYLTDSVQHFLTGSLYFRARPNYDSIYPSAVYIQNDIRTLMETLRWTD
jgi:gliding motility-associated lipoprotein GldD